MPGKIEQVQALNGHCETIRVTGLVQGVGFRPNVWKLATQYQLVGEVFNDGQGVTITVCGNKQNISDFIDDLETHRPPLSKIDKIQRQPCQLETGYHDFTITLSRLGEIHTGVVPDAATCEACLTEINDPQDRRYAYAFTNCTHCGPRLSIIRDIPYDRAHTSMSEFKLCRKCQQEFGDPSNRRFHAQPNACPDCGPSLTLTDNQGHAITREQSIEKAALLLEQGQIIALKGIGGYQLTCDATRDSVVTTLRQRKHRPDKALALMARNCDQVSDYCEMNEMEKNLLQSHQAPIVLLQRKKSGKHLAPSVAPGQNTLGFMLPYSPLHHLLMQQLTIPLVMTSGNVAEQPQCIDNQQALEQLSPIADYFLHHDRAIANRIDDSVLRVIQQQPQFYRRARGYAPAPLSMPPGLDKRHKILACGGELKNTFCLLKDGQATLSQHMGNLENSPTYDDYLKNHELYQRLFQFKPTIIAIDQHPEYLSSKLGRTMAQEQQLPLIEIQHHHAHIAACLADNGWPMQQGKVIGVALDGLGYGDDGTIWGGEFLLADYNAYQRLARFKPVPMPGGSQAILEPWRNTLAQLDSHLDWLDISQIHRDLELIKYLSAKPIDTIQRMIRKQINTPLTSSCGRLFDAVAAAIGLCRERISYEGQAAIELEALVDQQQLDTLSPYPFELEQKALLEINPAPMWKALLQDLHKQQPAASIAGRFHLCLVQIISTVVDRISASQGIKTIALSGGVFQNPTLLKLTTQVLQQKQYEVLIHKNVPANDGGLSLGQAAIAAARSG